ncbi:branched-chain alpha-keto acid dehydrogenase subunit E2 [Haematobacter massiliensis]|uniref:Dihydrolipoamide acetyltransferase component of pyruvate dehydrogenase complex n=1 Tax=Haematobacter massiliensis TaxID=195105 RepID=A0A086YAC9_9RHOB|nr:dihydrolipoamide acetyltransferase family protein [Haematobacter massiliensis]KFI31229.1 branched-chain alpha-keto acid dehydrogenase subunit E2 [Haematobacter massiliensis]OWJ74192.1 branched-chain alpha-keto acid dehydrogenase subunit E2 [Haematobacter massiliensis]OWJ83963.1 branched-chain alpha-keto acid dehydrogenase subunit E2 [Haematobacter massiliensis]QBJ23304.1 2-oxo acid dehydrogenase subunit E2 [Haematobacter massiliensis]
MGTLSIRMPDIGEGIAEAELVEWHVTPGDIVQEDQPLAAVMTDKATVEIPSPASGKVVWLGGEVGDSIAVKAELIRLEVEGEGNVSADAEPPVRAARAAKGESGTEDASPPAGPAAGPADNSPAGKSPAVKTPAAKLPTGETSPPAARPASRGRHTPSAALRPEGERPLATPSVRQRAREAGVDLRFVRGSGPAGRITHDDLSAHVEAGAPEGRPAHRRDGSVTEVKVVGLRRRIAERMQLSKRNIPHISIIEEVDVTGLEDLRAKLNAEGRGAAKLTLLPFLMKAIVRAVREQPALNALYDDEAGVVRQYGGVHIGIATQTPNGLMVPVVRHAEALTLREAAGELLRLAEAARDGSAVREELSGSTITITSLGPLGAIATTPIINHPEVAIVGVNRMQIRPFWDGTEFVPRKMMNISCSFDHRVIDGWDAAVFVQRLKTLLETPAMIFVEE